MAEAWHTLGVAQRRGLPCEDCAAAALEGDDTMGLLDRILGGLGGDERQGHGDRRGARPSGRPRSDDEIAVERYRYLLRTAPPDAVEQVHQEAFARLTPEQRRQVFEELKSGAAPGDRPASDDPRTLARSATRSELRQPGFLERSLGGGAGRFGGGGAGLGTVIGGSLLGTVAGVVIGSAVADLVLPGIGDLASDVFAGGEDLVNDVGQGVGDVGEGLSGFDAGGFFDGGGSGGDFGGGGDFGDF